MQASSRRFVVGALLPLLGGRRRRRRRACAPRSRSSTAWLAIADIISPLAPSFCLKSVALLMTVARVSSGAPRKSLASASAFALSLLALPSPRASRSPRGRAPRSPCVADTTLSGNSQRRSRRDVARPCRGSASVDDLLRACCREPTKLSQRILDRLRGAAVAALISLAALRHSLRCARAGARVDPGVLVLRLRGERLEVGRC